MATRPKSRTVWFGMKVTPEQKARIKRLAQREGTTAKEAILRLVDGAMQEPVEAAGNTVSARPGSFLDGIEHLIGSLEGPPDLSTNPRHLEGFGE